MAWTAEERGGLPNLRNDEVAIYTPFGIVQYLLASVNNVYYTLLTLIIGSALGRSLSLIPSFQTFLVVSSVRP